MRTVAFARATACAFVISIVASGVWGGLLVANLTVTPGVPWSAAVMLLVLWAGWRYLDGAGWPRNTSHGRHELLRARRVGRRVFVWTLIAGALALSALAGLWIVLVELTGVGGNPTIPMDPSIPHITVIVLILMGSLVSPLSEEAAFRGYAQVTLERAYPAFAAIAGSSLLFALWHGPTQGFAPSKLLFFFVVGVVFGAIAFLTRSTLPAIPVHIAGDLLFFFFIWPHDADRTLVLRDGADQALWIAVALLVVGSTASIWAFRRLAIASTRAEPAT